MRICTRILTLTAMSASALMLSGCGKAGDAEVDARIQRAEDAAKRAEEAQAKAENAAKKAIIFSSHSSGGNDVPIDAPAPPPPPTGPERAANQDSAMGNTPDQVGNS